MKLPEYISFETPELALIAAEHLERVHGLEREANIKPETQNSYFWTGGAIRLLLHGKSVSWSDIGKSRFHATTFKDFIALLGEKRWAIGCRTIEVSSDGKSLYIRQDNITIPKSTLEAMLEALS